MTQILLVRMSSLGDILHTFPAATDLRRAFPNAVIDWVVEEAYVPLVRMHPGVSRAIPIGLRRWRRKLLSRPVWGEMAAFRRNLRTQRYDAILDTQGLVKSAVVAAMAHGPVHGFGKATAREPVVSRFYHRTYEFSAADHKVERYRQVAASALGYERIAAVDYGIVAPPPPAFAPAGKYCVLLHATARVAKLWQERAWVEVGRAIEARGAACVLPWGDEAERERSARIAASLKAAVIPPRMSLEDAAGLVGNSAAVLGVDTGLMHLAAALQVPVVGIFCDSEPLDAHPLGRGRTAHRGGIGMPPSPQDVLGALREVQPGLFSG